MELLKSFLTLFTGAVLWQGFKFFYPDAKRYFHDKKIAKETFYKNIAPILKVSSELYGKIESLAKEDFSTFVKPQLSNSIDPEHNKIYIYYLFSQFWAQLEYLRLESQYIDISKINKGLKLLRFIEAIESRKYRILDRSIQRIIGECLISQKDQKFRIMTLNEFMIQFDDTSSNLHKWVIKLRDILELTNNKDKRQKILVFGVIVAALIDYFDPQYKIVRRRNIYVNKLNNKSVTSIKNHLAEHYLPFLERKEILYKKSEPAGN